MFDAARRRRQSRSHANANGIASADNAVSRRQRKNQRSAAVTGDEIANWESWPVERIEANYELVQAYEACESAETFITSHCKIEDPNRRGEKWFGFDLWPMQRDALRDIEDANKAIILKARQLGMSWLVLAFALWLMVMEPGATILIFSRTDTEATELLRRLKGMYERLPDWLRPSAEKSNDHALVLANGSSVQAFRTTKNSGRTFTASLVIIDEADFIQWLKQLMNAAEPTADAGGRVILISTSDKEKPLSKFKSIWKKAVAKLNGYRPIFLPWSARPTRTKDWYKQKVQSEEQDDLWQEYPATAEEALAGRTSGKRFMLTWIKDKCKGSAEPLDLSDIKDEPATALPGLIVYALPDRSRRYLIAADTSEGDPTSDPSPAVVIDMDSWEEVAHIFGRFEPDTYANYLGQLGEWYVGRDGVAILCVERNNHGHSVINSLTREPTIYPRLYRSPFDKKLGWLTSPKSKLLMMNNGAAVLKAGDCTIHTEATRMELADIDAATLKAPEGKTDDLAMMWLIALAALRWPSLGVKKRKKYRTTQFNY